MADYLVDTDVLVDHLRGAEWAGRLRREAGIRLPDALIAATAIEHELSLFTRNRSNFEKVRGLRIREIR